jgi:hypothetical protein
VTNWATKRLVLSFQLVLNTETIYGLSVDHDAEGTPIIWVAPVVKIGTENAEEKIKTLCP